MDDFYCVHLSYQNQWLNIQAVNIQQRNDAYQRPNMQPLPLSDMLRQIHLKINKSDRSQKSALLSWEFVSFPQFN